MDSIDLLEASTMDSIEVLETDQNNPRSHELDHMYVVTEEGDLIEESQVAENDYLSRPCSSASGETTPSQRNKGKRKSNISDTLVEKATKSLEQISAAVNSANTESQKLDDDDILAKVIASKLKKIKNTKLKLQTEQSIFNIIYDAMNKDD